MFGSRKRNQRAIDEVLNERLFHWPDHPSFEFYVRDACEGIQVFGATGSGKSSGSGKHIAEAYLSYGYGGLVLCAKPDEKNAWEAYARNIGRLDDLVIFEMDGDYEFNPLAYEMMREGEGGGQTINMVNMVMAMHQIGKNFMAGGEGSANDERFWDDSVRRLLSRTIDLLKFAEKEITIPNMRRVVAEALTEGQVTQYRDRINTINDSESSKDEVDQAIAQIKRWRADNFCLDCLSLAFERMEEYDDLALDVYRMVEGYFFREFARLSERTKSIIQESFLGLVEPFGTGLLQKHFTRGVSDEIYPEMTYQEGKIIILNFPTKQHLLSGVLAQAIYKYVWQQAMERRTFEDGNFRPTFLWIDESQFFVLPEYDTLFATTARSSLVSTVYLTQNINNYYFSMGANSQARTKSLMGNMSTKIFHANTDIDTNEFAAKTIAEDLIQMQALQLNPGSVGAGSSFSEQYMFQVKPKDFTTLATGGKAKHGFKPEAYIVQTGETFERGLNYLKVGFPQRRK